VDTLGQLCCPSRDEGNNHIDIIIWCLIETCGRSQSYNIVFNICIDVEALRNLEGVGKIFRGILGVMDKMKVDMANFYIQQFRPCIVRQVVQYEREKFAQFLEIEYILRTDGLRVTKNWLMRHKIGKRDTATVMSKAFGELLVYDMKFGWPEVL